MRIDHKTHLQEDYRCQEKTHLENGIPLTLVSPWQNPSFLLLPYYLASNMLSPDTSLTLISPVSSWGGWGQSHHWIKSYDRPPPFNVSHLKPSPDLPLTPKSAIDFLPRAPNRNLPIDINFDVNPVLVQPHNFLWSPSCFFMQNSFKYLTVRTHR